MKTQILRTQADIVRFLENTLSFHDLVLQVFLEGNRLTIIFNLMPDSQLTYQGLADILLERMVEASFPTLNFLLLQGRV